MQVQKEAATKLAAAGMNAEGAAMHAAVLNHIAQNSPELETLVNMAQDTDDLDFKAQIVSGILHRVSEIILKDPELLNIAAN